MQSHQQQYLKEMGIDVWIDRESEVLNVADESSNVSQAKAEPVNEQNQKPAQSSIVLPEGLAALKEEVSVCQKCELHQTRTQTVFGVGNPNADWLIIGEAPGADEDKQGEPFVGRAGQLLNSMLLAMGLQREQVFIANILKCRPPNNRDPQPEEVVACESYLRQQIELIKPKVILAVGRIAAQNLLKVDTPIGKMRGNRYQYPDSELPVIVTYHPAYLLRSPREKRKVWEDLKIAMKLYKEIGA
ncbi:MAG: uracil-DNA glycosylase [Proteobacteria bacterium]|nr:uracil-DNA glycosylase [Pseudomonadota bacterium]NOG60148.1 uracil-DNA glycosylase [Pseudomonadota bacterium]